VLVRQVLGAIAQFEKASLVAKLKAARDRKTAQGIKCGGRKSYAERFQNVGTDTREYDVMAWTTLTVAGGEEPYRIRRHIFGIGRARFGALCF
jgi:DNA invertase Pin-like site-specific DNA recombinase